MSICLVTIVLIKAITYHSKLSQSGIFHCSSSGSFCVNGVHFNRAHGAHWKQLLSYFSTSHKRRGGIFQGPGDMPTANHATRAERAKSWQLMPQPTSRHWPMSLPHADVLLLLLLKTNRFPCLLEECGVCLAGESKPFYK